jgi:hypothetical protein
VTLVELLLTMAEAEMRLPIAEDDELCLSFRHSVYGSTVVEAFSVGRDGLSLQQLRYSEARLADYYGYDHANRVGDLWIVEGDGRRHHRLSLRVSSESEMKLSVGSYAIDLRDLVVAGGAVQISVDGRCAHVAASNS